MESHDSPANSRQRPRRVQGRALLLGAAAVAALVAITAGLAAYFYPLQLYDAYERAALRLGGTSQLRSAGLHAYLSDHCGQQQNCTCVALVHGMVDSSLRWRKILLASDDAWKKAGLVNTGLKIYAWDLPGTNGSDPPATPAGYRVRTQAESLRAALAPVCPHWVVVGNSLGGWIAMWLALEWPEGVDKLMLVDSAGLTIDRNDPLAKTFFNPTAGDMRGFMQRLFYHPPKMTEHMLPMLAERFRKRHTSEIAGAQVPDDFVEGRAPALRKPTLILWGEEDRIIPIDQGRELSKLIPGSIWRETPQCGHLPETERPSETLHALVDLINLGRF